MAGYITLPMASMVTIDEPEMAANREQDSTQATPSPPGSGLVMAAGSLFQGMGDTRPSLIASATRMLTFVAPVLWASQQPWFTLHDVWLISVASVVAQCALVTWLLFRTFGRKLGPAAAPIAAAAG